MGGNGEIWIDQDGLPSRLVLTLEFPAHAGQERATSIITSDYTGFDHTRLALVSTPFFKNPVAWVSFRFPIYAPLLRQFVIMLILGLAATLGCWLWLRRLHHRRVHTITVGVLIGAMLTGPLFSGAQMRAFAAEQTAEKAALESQQIASERLSEAQANLTENTWNPQQDPKIAKAQAPLESGLDELLQRRPDLALPGLLAATGSTDTDGDGLSDDDEATWGACPSATSTSADCDGVIDPTDSDGDGLDDGTEVNDLGILPDEWHNDLDCSRHTSSQSVVSRRAGAKRHPMDGLPQRCAGWYGDADIWQCNEQTIVHWFGGRQYKFLLRHNR